MWRLLGISHIIIDACRLDRSGFVVLEYLLRLPNSSLLYMPSIRPSEGIDAAFGIFGGYDKDKLMVKVYPLPPPSQEVQSQSKSFVLIYNVHNLMAREPLFA